MKQISLGQDHNRDSPDDDAEIRPKLRAIIAEKRKALIQERMSADIGCISMPTLPWFNHVFSFQRAIYRRQRSEEFAGGVAVDKDMAYGFADKIRQPGGGFNSVAFMRKRLVPRGSRTGWLRICPSAQLPGSDPEYLAGAFLGKTMNDGFIYDINHSLFDLKFEMAV